MSTNGCWMPPDDPCWGCWRPNKPCAHGEQKPKLLAGLRSRAGRSPLLIGENALAVAGDAAPGHARQEVQPPVGQKVDEQDCEGGVGLRIGL